MRSELFDGLAAGYGAVRDRVLDHYGRHRELYDAAGAVGAGVGAYFLASTGLGALGLEPYLASALPALGEHAQTVAGATVSLIAAAGAKVPAKLGVKHLLGKYRKSDGRRELREEAALEGGRELAHEGAEELLQEGAEAALAGYVIGFPLSFSDVRELYRGVRSEWRAYRERRAARLAEEEAERRTKEERRSVENALGEPSADALGEDDVAPMVWTERCGDYVARLREGMEERRYPF